MRDGGAVMAASQILRQPALVRVVRKAPLPRGMTFLLEVAAGDADALSEASRLTGDSPSRLTEAAGFFVEQILFMERADHYRILGAPRNASTADLRHHMALLMRWLHPDIYAERPTGRVDRSVLATRITAAWQTLKVDDRRAAYDASLNASRAASDAEPHSGHSSLRSRRYPRLSLHHLEGEGFISRLLLFLQGRR